MSQAAPPPRVLITGAASGIGAAVAHTFAAAGWAVWGLDRQPPPPDLHGAGWTLCDLAAPSAVDRAVENLGAQTWAALVGCAGVAGVGDPERVLQINFIAARRVVEALKPHITDDGAVVLISSGAGMKWTARKDVLLPVLDAPDDASALALAAALSPSPAKAYEVSKELLSFYGARSCLDAMSRGVRTNVISPGGVETPLIPAFTQSMGQEAMDFSISVTQRHGRPQEIADVVLFLASPQASWINGAEIRVDGGLTGALTAGAVDFPGWR